MKNNANNVLNILLIIFIIISILLSGYIVYDAVLSDVENSTDETTNIVTNNNKTDNNENSSGGTSNNNVFETDYIRQIRVVLIDEPKCSGNSTPLIASINSDKNIGIYRESGHAAEEVIVGNVKYLYKVDIISCDNVRLYYITDDGGLYIIDRPSDGKPNQKGIKVSSSKIIEFLGEDHRDDGSYLKVLTADKNVEYIKYFTTPDYWNE